MAQYHHRGPNARHIRICESTRMRIFCAPVKVRSLKARIFQALSHPTRLAILETLSLGELPVGAILVRVGTEQANVSQHLAVLRAGRLVTARKDGNQVFYSVRDPRLLDVLNVVRGYVVAHLEEDLALLEELKAEDARP